MASAEQKPLWAWFSLSWTMDLGVGKPTHHDVKMIKTNHATQDGRMKNAKCRPNRSGDSSSCRSGIHEGMFWGAIGYSKERCKRTRERTAINHIDIDLFHLPRHAALTVFDKGTYSPRNKPGNHPLDRVASFRDGPTDCIREFTNLQRSTHLQQWNEASAC